MGLVWLGVWGRCLSLLVHHTRSFGNLTINHVVSEIRNCSFLCLSVADFQSGCLLHKSDLIKWNIGSLIASMTEFRGLTSLTYNSVVYNPVKDSQMIAMHKPSHVLKL